MNNEENIQQLDLHLLKMAIDANNLYEVTQLIKGINPSELNQLVDDVDTPLYQASIRDHTKIVKVLLEAGADPNITDRNNESALYIASVRGHLTIVKLLLSFGGNPNIIDSVNDRCGLTWASSQGYIETAKLLLEAGADPNILDRANDIPLGFASVNGQIEIVKLLLSAGADPNIPDNYNHTPLFWASSQNSKEIVELLLSSGANPNIANKKNETPYSMALGNGHTKIVNLLQNWKPLNPDEYDKHGRTALMDLIINGYYPAFKSLLSLVKNINAQDNDGNTALHLAIIHKRKNMVRDLLDKYNINDIANHDKKIPLDYAVEILKKDKDDTYIRELFQTTREVSYGGKYYEEARRHFTKTLERKVEDPLLADPETLKEDTLKDLANIFSLFEDDWDLFELCEEIRKIQAALRSLSPEEQDRYLEDLYIQYIKNNY